jgi:hypothetical protein
LVRRADLPAITAALEQAGFVRDDVLEVVMFRDGPQGKPSEAIHLLFAGEKAFPTICCPRRTFTPSLTRRAFASSRSNRCS